MDKMIFLWLNGFYGRAGWFDVLAKFLAVDLIYGVPALLVILFCFRRTRWLSFGAFISAAIAWQGVAQPLGVLINRPRPFMALPEIERVFHRPAYSFPSDHAAFLAALATYFWLAGERRLASGLALAAALILLSRIIVGVHWPSDILGGIIIGVAAGWGGYKITQKAKGKITDLTNNHNPKLKTGLK